MKMSPQFQKAQDNMTPGEITADGFLGSDRRPLVDIIEADEEKLQALGLTFEDIGDKLQSLMDQGRRGLGEPITVDGTWLVQINEARGFLPCPFEDGIFRKITATVTHQQKRQSLAYSALSLHLLNAHHFLQGRGSPFRLDPGTLKDVLEP